MSDSELRDLLHDRVADVTMPDVSGRAWEAGRRRQRRRTAGVVAGSVAAVAVAAVVVAGAGGSDRAERPVPPATGVPSPTPSVPEPTRVVGPDPGGSRPDGRYRGWAVYAGPSVEQEAALPRASSPFPDTVDLSAPAPALADRPIRSALAAYAVSDDAGGTRLLLLAGDGSLRTVDTSRVAPLDDGAGADVSVARDTLLSPTGQYLAFPQARSVLVLTLATGAWRTVDTGDVVTTTLRWAQDTELWLPRSSQGGWGPLFSAVDGTRAGAEHLLAPAAPFARGAGPYGRWALGPGGLAQSWARVEGLPAPGAGAGPAQVVLAQGSTAARDALLVLGAASSSSRARADFCCGVAFWLRPGVVVYGAAARPRMLVAWRVGTHQVSRVTSIVGYADREYVDASYRSIWR